MIDVTTLIGVALAGASLGTFSTVMALALVRVGANKDALSEAFDLGYAARKRDEEVSHAG